LALRPFTIIRSHLQFMFTTDQLAQTETPFGGIGQVVVTDQAQAIGVTAVPDPVTEPDADWFVYQPWMVDFHFATASGFNSSAGSQYTVDSKAMRKVGNNQTFITVGANSNTGDGAIVTGFGRQLIKLH